MTKKCIICGAEAEFYIKNSSEYYCEECALMQFGDLGYLLRLDRKAKILRDYLKEKEGAQYDEELFEN